MHRNECGVMEAPSVFVLQEQGCNAFLVCTENSGIRVLHHLVHRAALPCESLHGDVHDSLIDVINMEKKIQTATVKIVFNFLIGDSTLCGV